MNRIFPRTKVILVMIIVFLGGLVFLRRNRSIITCGISVPHAHIQQFRVALLIYRKRSGFYPTTEQGLKALTVQPATDPIPYKWSTLMMTVPKDPWGSDYIYEQPGKHNPDSYDFYSPGADGAPGAPDDIGNWE